MSDACKWPVKVIDWMSRHPSSTVPTPGKQYSSAYLCKENTQSLTPPSVKDKARGGVQAQMREMGCSGVGNGPNNATRCRTFHSRHAKDSPANRHVRSTADGPQASRRMSVAGRATAQCARQGGEGTHPPAARLARSAQAIAAAIVDVPRGRAPG